MKKNFIVALCVLGSLTVASTVLAQSRYFSARGTLGNGYVDLPLPRGTYIPAPLPIRGTLGNNRLDIPLLPYSMGLSVYGTLGNGYVDLPLPGGTYIPAPLPIRGTLGNNRLDIPLPPIF